MMGTSVKRITSGQRTAIDPCMASVLTVEVRRTLAPQTVVAGGLQNLLALSPLRLWLAVAAAAAAGEDLVTSSLGRVGS